MPPIIEATCWPSTNSPPGGAATTPVASMPSTRGKVTPWARPRRVCSSDRLIPNALTRMSTQPGRGSGTASSRIRSPAGAAARFVAKGGLVLRPPTAAEGCTDLAHAPGGHVDAQISAHVYRSVGDELYPDWLLGLLTR